MFAAYRAGSSAGGVGHRSSPISHLSGTMRALLEASPAFRNWGEELGVGETEEAKARLGKSQVSQCLNSFPFLSPPPCPLPFPSPQFNTFIFRN